MAAVLKTFKDGAGADFNKNIQDALGRQPAAESPSITLSTEDLAAINQLHTDLGALQGFVDGLEGLNTALGTKLDTLITQGGSTAPVLTTQADEYETVAASQTDQVLGTTGAVGDRLAGILIQPATTSPGNVIIKDGTTTIFTFPGGASSVSNLATIIVGLGIKSVSGAWKITTGANVSVDAVGDFT